MAPRVSTTVNEGHQNSYLAQQVGTTINEGHPNSQLAPHVRPDMAAYRDGEDTLMHDAESDTSNELGWSTVKAGKRRVNVESDDDSMHIISDVDDENHHVSLESLDVDGLADMIRRCHHMLYQLLISFQDLKEGEDLV